MQEWRVHRSQTHQREDLITDQGQAKVRIPKDKAGRVRSTSAAKGKKTLSLREPDHPRRG